MRFAIAAVFGFMFAVCMGSARQPESRPGAAALRISGLGVQPLSLSEADLATLPRSTLTVSDRDDQKNTYEGVSVQSILTKAGMAFGQSMRGPRLRDFILAESPEKYGVVFAIAEISDEFSDRKIIVADKVNGAPIAGRDGPLRVIVSDEKKHARWVRNVNSLTVRTAAEEPVK
jgi:hypothetical protein